MLPYDDVDKCDCKSDNFDDLQKIYKKVSKNITDDTLQYMGKNSYQRRKNRQTYRQRMEILNNDWFEDIFASIKKKNKS